MTDPTDRTTPGPLPEFVNGIHLPTVRALVGALEKVAPAETVALFEVVKAKHIAHDDALTEFLTTLQLLDAAKAGSRSAVTASEVAPDPKSPFDFRFRYDLAKVINGHSMENGSNTPDFILADLLSEVLHAFNRAANARATWYGRTDAPGQGTQLPGSDPVAATGMASSRLPVASNDSTEASSESAEPSPAAADAMRTIRDLNAMAFKGCNALAAFGGSKTMFAIRWVSEDDGDSYFDHLGRRLTTPVSLREAPLDFILDYYDTEQRTAAVASDHPDLPPAAKP